MKQIIIFAFMFCQTLAIVAQPQERAPQHRFDPRQYQQCMEQSLTRDASFTPEEAKAFFTLHNEMQEKQRAIISQIHQLKKQTAGNTDPKACASAIAKIKSLKVNIAEVEKEYYKRLCKAVPPEKVFKAMQAEDNFHRRMVKNGRKSGKAE